MQRPRGGAGPETFIRGIASSWMWLRGRDGIEGVPVI